ncbi:MAG: hypothetical protein FJY77_01675 [Candidatus Altiarchaeales archaeon]|nr:hypothetical protein [Candidatus Altiarchaeales archaeon]
MKKDTNVNVGIFVGLIFCLILVSASAQPTPPELAEFWILHDGIKNIASALGALIFVNSGVRWIAAQSPEERDDAKKTIIYVIVGLIAVAIAKDIVEAIYCNALTIAQTGSCT